MIAIGNPCSDWYSAVYAIAFVATFIIALITCVCNPKSKRFHKHKSFILSHDLPNEVPLDTDLTTAQTAFPAQSSSEIDSCNKLKAISVHRALPDIPQVAGSGAIPDGSAPFSNSTSFGDVVDDVDSLYTVANNCNAIANSNNHPYARIRNHLLVDSSTENDTDDYSESRIPAAVASVQCHSESGQFRAPIHEPNDTYEMEPQPHILRLQLRNNIEPPLFNNNEPEEKQEISYNTISVREPLSKVLAERENIEHHYNEVEEEERISSFYEEITSGSLATYSKINEINKASYGEPIASTSHHTEHNVRNIGAPSNASPETNGPLYSFVDKKMKRANLTSTNSNALSEANNLYTMVVKSPGSGVSVADTASTKPILKRYSPPPPLPPPIHRDTQPKMYRNTIMFGTPSNSSSIDHQHHNYNILSDEVDQQNIYHKIARQDSEKDPGYEVVDRNDEMDKMVDPNQNDYGYEAIAMDESDPAYEIVKASNTSDDNNPAYETIKNETYSQSEDQSDPNYEIIPNTRVVTTIHVSGAHPGESDTNVNSNTYIIDENVIIEHL